MSVKKGKKSVPQCSEVRYTEVIHWIQTHKSVQKVLKEFWNTG